jgi:hypothetical protein
MACSKYTLTNTGSTSINFNYQRCDDLMWEYQVKLDENETKNIWLINQTFQIAELFTTNLLLINNGSFPFPITPTPTATPVVPTATPVVPTATPIEPTATPIEPTATPIEPTATPIEPTATPIEPTATPITPTPTPTNTVLENYNGLGTGLTSTDACLTYPSLTNYYGTATTFNSLVLGDFIYLDSIGTIPASNIYLSDGTNYVQVDSNGEVIVGLTVCVAPTATPIEPTATPIEPTATPIEPTATPITPTPTP